jgi:hypothetical protein
MVTDSLMAIVLTVVIAVTPTVLFLLFWRFLVALRDDALVDRLAYDHGFDPVGDASSAGRSFPTLVSCDACGSRTVAVDGRCSVCGDALSG